MPPCPQKGWRGRFGGGYSAGVNIAISLLNFRPGLVGGGTETYLRRLMAELPALAERDRISLLVHRGNADAIDSLLDRAVVDLEDRGIVAWRCAEAFSPLRCRPAERELTALRPDVVLFPQQSMFPRSPGCPSVLTVHDLQHLLLPEYFSLAHRAFRRAIYNSSLTRANRIIAISEFTRSALVSQAGVAAGKVVTIPHGFDVSPPSGQRRTGQRAQLGEREESDRSAGPPPVAGRYLYYPAATFPHKGHAALLESLAALRRAGQFTDVKLVLTGLRTGYWKAIERRIDALGLREAVVHLGFVPYQQVLALYRGAWAVVYPTQYEGFGLPVLEAAAAGRKLITSRLSVFDEIGVPASSQIDFADPAQLAAALADPSPTVLTKTPWTWRQTAQATLDLLRRTAREGASI